MTDKRVLQTRTRQTEILRPPWLNFKTQEYDHRETPGDFTDYIPQSPPAQALYRLLTNEMERTPIEAAKEVLAACCGKLEEAEQGGGEDHERSEDNVATDRKR